MLLYPLVIVFEYVLNCEGKIIYLQSARGRRFSRGFSRKISSFDRRICCPKRSSSSSVLKILYTYENKVKESQMNILQIKLVQNYHLLDFDVLLPQILSIRGILTLK